MEEEFLNRSMTGITLTDSQTGPVNSGHMLTEIQYSRLQFLNPYYPGARMMRNGDERGDGRTDLGGASRRQWAQLLDHRGEIQEHRIIVEFKDRPPRPTSDQDVGSVKREIRSLVRELQLGSKTFLVLYCHGFHETPAHYGIVYQLPSSIIVDEFLQCESLGNILLEERYTQLLANNLDNRLSLAKSLATTMYHLHSVQWVHKTFNPDNILLFGRKSFDGCVKFDWSRPYLVGFDTSRPNLAHSDKLPACLRWENRLYTHPARQRQELPRFHKVFDIYSLGVVLLEIGNLQCFKHSSYRRDLSWTDIPAYELQARFVACAGQLRRTLGRTYSEIVEVCLSGNFGIADHEDDAHETHLLDAFRSEVCEKFDQIHY